jgi:hypothetical protein
MLLLSQRDPRWSGHALGFGPNLGTIGKYGCKLVVFDMIVYDAFSDMHYFPNKLDEIFDAKKVYTKDPTGTYDFLPDNALGQVWPSRFEEFHYTGFRADLVEKAIPSKDTYAYVWFHTKSLTHFTLMYGKTAIADPWTGKVASLSTYGGPATVGKTVLIRKKPQVVAAPTPTPAPAPVPAPEPLPPPDANPVGDPGLPTPPPPGKYGCLWVLGEILNAGTKA